MIRKPYIFILLSCLPCLFLSGCAGLLDPGPPISNVILPAQMPAPSSAGRLPVQILVTRPAADAATGTDRIMALMNGFEIKALDSAKWVDPVPQIIQRQVVDSLESTRRFAAVDWEASNLDAKFRLATDLRRFYLRYDSPGKAPTADVLMVFALINPDTGAILARRLARVEEQCGGNSLKDFVAAFSEAMTKVLAETSQWVIEVVESQPQQTVGTRK